MNRIWSEKRYIETTTKAKAMHSSVKNIGIMLVSMLTDNIHEQSFSLPYALDHCIEAIRQVLMCNSDTRLVFFHWVDGWPGPVPDFSTWHQCRDPEVVLKWGMDNAAPIRRRLWKPDGAIALSERP